MSDHINGNCPKCGGPFAGDRRRCYRCNPGGAHGKVLSVAAVRSIEAAMTPHSGAKEPDAERIAEIESLKAAMTPEPGEARCIADAVKADPREELRRAFEAKAQEQRERVRVERGTEGKRIIPFAPPSPEPEKINRFGHPAPLGVLASVEVNGKVMHAALQAQEKTKSVSPLEHKTPMAQAPNAGSVLESLEDTEIKSPRREPAPLVAVSTEDHEMAVLFAAVGAIKKLEPDGQGRVLRYLADRFGATT